MTQVIEFFALIGRQRHDVTDQHLVRIGSAARQHLHAIDSDAAVIFSGDAKRRLLQPMRLIVVLVARGRRRHECVGGKDVVAPQVLVDAQKIAAVSSRLGVEHFRLHRQTGDVAGDRIGRPAHQAETKFGNLAVRTRAPAQIFLRARLQVIHAVAFVAIGESHDVT